MCNPNGSIPYPGARSPGGGVPVPGTISSGGRVSVPGTGSPGGRVPVPGTGSPGGGRGHFTGAGSIGSSMSYLDAKGPRLSTSKANRNC